MRRFEAWLILMTMEKLQSLRRERPLPRVQRLIPNITPRNSPLRPSLKSKSMKWNMN
jgi:hypothetical protein